MNSQEMFAHNMGSRIFGPFLRSYVLWLHRSAKRDGIERLVFFARDGYLMQQMYKRVIPLDEQLPSVYMYSSRRLFNVAAIEELNPRVLKFLTSDRVEMPVRLYLERIGIDADFSDEQLVEFGFEEGLDTIVRAEMIPQLKRFFLSIEDEILTHVRAERRKLLEYADGVADWWGEKCAVVDVGWHGTLQESLTKVLGMPAGSLQGYYLGLVRSARKDRDQPMSAFLDESRVSDYLLYRFAVNRCVDLYELLFSEMAGSIIALDKDGKGGFLPVREPFNGALEQYAVIEQIQQEILAQGSMHNLVAAVRRLVSWLPLVRLLSFPTLNEARRLGDIFQRSGFGRYGEVGYLAMPMHNLRYYLRHPFAYTKELRSVYWQRGFALRALLDRREHY